jgi:hypothetical protein
MRSLAAVGFDDSPWLRFKRADEPPVPEGFLAAGTRHFCGLAQT